MKSFEKWKYQELQNYFGLHRVYKHEKLLQWIGCKDIVISEKEKELLLPLQERLIYEIDAWQEDELKSFFIIPVIDIVAFWRYEKYKSFTQRNVSATLKTLQNELVTINGRVEFLVAKGMQDPEKPYFFLHEYKREHSGQSDPIGQLLAAMFASQSLNDDTKTLYGLYIIGRNWFFVILEGKAYSISKAYDATEYEPLMEILKILKKVKAYIYEWEDEIV